MQKEWKIKALTMIWTGDTNRKSELLIPTGIMGSLRWWFEVLVRGLGGKACDPTAKEVRCEYDPKDPRPPEQQLCVACYLFGCTGWARKFRLMILDEKGQVFQKQIRAGRTFILRFIPLRPIREEEWCLLDATLRLIADYGAIGGRTVFKPSEEWGIADLGADDLEDSTGEIRVQRSRRGLPLQRSDVILEVAGAPVSSKSQLEELLVGKPHGERILIKVKRRNGVEEEIEGWAGKRHHQDFGLIAVEQRPEGVGCGRAVVEAYVRDARWRNAPHSYGDHESVHDFSWASLQNFWCVKGRYLARQDANTSSFNFVIGRPELKSRSSQGNSWLAGWPADRAPDSKPHSKKVFSFAQPKNACRAFGFVENERGFLQVLSKLGTLKRGGNGRQPDRVWDSFNPDSEFLKAEQILDRLFQWEEGA